MVIRHLSSAPNPCWWEMGQATEEREHMLLRLSSKRAHFCIWCDDCQIWYTNAKGGIALLKKEFVKKMSHWCCVSFIFSPASFHQKGLLESPFSSWWGREYRLSSKFLPYNTFNNYSHYSFSFPLSSWHCLIDLHYSFIFSCSVS